MRRLVSFQFPLRYLMVKGEIRQTDPCSCKATSGVAKRPREFLDSRSRRLRRFFAFLSQRATRAVRMFFVEGLRRVLRYYLINQELTGIQ